MWTDAQREKYKDDGRRYPSDLTDAEWEMIRPLLTEVSTESGECHLIFTGRSPWTAAHR